MTTGRGTGWLAQRHECKYLVPESVAQRVLRRVESFVTPDPFAARRSDHCYAISSLYLDTANLRLYHETRSGDAQRFKLRVRAYTDDPAVPIFVEIKRRIDRVVHKLRCPIPRGWLPGLLDGHVPDVSALSPEKRRSLEEFVRLQQSLRARPTLLVRYDRQAYMGRDDDEVRVTIDRRLRVLPMPRPEVWVEHPRFLPVSMGGVVIELKFTNRAPAWMLDTVQACDLRRISFSKYCNSVDRADPAAQLAT
ncbi:MAG: polyphosphate polymerase domain-containing protein [Planctomycetes bacterium]|nr:polyphosphate polymerase domain-containing protein [Planctomycetota bacterium]